MSPLLYGWAASGRHRWPGGAVSCRASIVAEIFVTYQFARAGGGHGVYPFIIWRYCLRLPVTGLARAMISSASTLLQRDGIEYQFQMIRQVQIQHHKSEKRKAKCESVKRAYYIPHCVIKITWLKSITDIKNLSMLPGSSGFECCRLISIWSNYRLILCRSWLIWFFKKFKWRIRT